ncbi:SRPBCC domain-containing protein [Tabrizicola sp. J26]|uniref:SRPBCC domain-containing protein n=1 Tax=Alitabrizicola rongguiensis TaxID=2909234 RepID=UPI001F31C345|nr:SRPBCC domain-containing protein [Tabrizicola rongguiensis]MCF1707237.1 SRPBCC domain-containing protein [Tabrizicola rongguiensis]
MTEDRQITLSRLIRAPQSRVWQAWTDPQLLPQWFGPEGYSCQTKEIDLREGGVWRFDMIGPDGKVWANRHRITRHDPERRIEFILDSDDDASPRMQVVVTMEPEADGTRLTQVMTFPDAAMRDGAISFGAVELGKTTLSKLARLVEA